HGVMLLFGVIYTFMIKVSILHGIKNQHLLSYKPNKQWKSPPNASTTMVMNAFGGLYFVVC
ncbi:hypothetical protein, partial [Veillonella caviae]|uniref:hypothetical protein n=1 Tax=Veillonella caviae TaxID=248316 RepID=UPI0019CFDB01